MPLVRRPMRALFFRPSAFRTKFLLSHRYNSTAARPDILLCENCDLYKFGDPTSEPSRALFRNLSWRIQDSSPNPSSDANNAWALIGPRATQLADAALLGRSRADPPSSRSWPFLGTTRLVESAIKKVSFNTRLESKSHLAVAGEFTDYTARYFSIRADEEEATTLRKHLEQYLKKDNQASLTPRQGTFLQETTKQLKLDHLLDIPLVALSNGQTRRARIARALLMKPEVLILEEPFTGLDVASRKLIADLLGSMHAAQSPRIVLILRPQDTVPDWVDSIIETSSTQQQEPNFIGSRSSWSPSTLRMEAHGTPAAGKRKIADPAAPVVTQLDNGNIQYGPRRVLSDVSWTLRAGDRVALTGANGSGKSTLLSLILGDHPASYSQALSIFGKPREKQSTYSLSAGIGQFSPELYAAFPRRYGEAGLTLFEAIGTGFDNIFTYRKLSEERKTRIHELLRAFDPSEEYFSSQTLHKTLFVEASPPLQALTLIMRALVKKPKLLILDEPFAGMNDALIQKCRQFLDTQLQEDQTLVFISHYPEEWPATLGKRFHLEDGRATETFLE